jgi:hypothetical protein
MELIMKTMKLWHGHIVLGMLCIFSLTGCINYHITAADNHEEIKQVWEYCKQCLNDINCTERSTCEQNTTSETLSFTLSQALWFGKLDVIKYLVEVVGFDVDTPLSRYQQTALFYCASYGGPQDYETARYLISKNANVNAIATGRDRTPLLTAIRKKNNAIARLLLSHGANLSQPEDACLMAYFWENWNIMPNIPDCCVRLASLPDSQNDPPELLKVCKRNGT